MSINEVRIVLSSVSNDAVSQMLRAITRAISERDPDRVAHGLLGGDDGYGGDWNSGVFEMRPFYWGDCTCGADDAKNDRPHDESCALMLPNFVHHKSGMTVSWYKYIGRGMDVENCPKSITDVLIECLRDVNERR